MAAVSTVAVFGAVEPLELGLEGVWAGLSLLMMGRLITLVWRYQQLDGPLPPGLPETSENDD